MERKSCNSLVPIDNAAGTDTDSGRRMFPRSRGRQRLLLGLAAACLIVAIQSTGTFGIDYSTSGSSGSYDMTGHATVSSGPLTTADALGTTDIRFEFCAGKQESGEIGCCCTDNCAACGATGVSQLCEPGDCASPCATCCHASGGGGEIHQSCCSQDAPSGDVCCGGWAGCTVRMRRVRVCSAGSKCSGASNVKVVLCDNTDVDGSNDCPAAGVRLDETITVNTSLRAQAGIDVLTQDELCEIHNCQTDIFIEFESEVAQAGTGAQITGRIVRIGTKSTLSSSVAGVLCPKVGTDGCADIPAMADWGVVTLTGLLLSAGAIVILRQRRQSRLSPPTGL